MSASLVFASTLVLFAPSLTHALLHWDDHYHLTDNPFLQPDATDRYAHFWREPYGKLYVPITYNAWAWLYGRSFDAGGTFSPRLLHAANVLVHALTCVLAFLVLRRLLRGTGVQPVTSAVLGAMLFALHPLQVESVAWISELRGLLAALFGMAATLAYFDASSHRPDVDRLAGRARTVIRVGLPSVLLAAAMLCKPSVAALPLVWFATDRLLVRRPLRETAAALAVPAVLVVTSLFLMRSLQGGGPTDAVALWQRPLVAGDALAFYLGRLVWPFGLCADYSRTPAAVLASPAAYIAWLAPLLVGVAAYVALKQWRFRTPITALAIFVAAFAPVLGLVPFDFQRISTVADRYAYLAMLGPALLLAAVVRRDGRFALPAMVLLAMLGWRSVDQQRSWRDDATLWRHAVAVNPRAVVATSNLADAAAQRGDAREADRLFRRVIAIAPHRGSGYRGLARLAVDAGDAPAALRWYEQAIAADPTDAPARDGSGQMFQALGDFTSAEARYRDAVRVDPSFADGWNDLGAFLIGRGRAGEAVDVLRRATTIHPRHPTAWFNRALAEDATAAGLQAVESLRRGEGVTGGPNAGVRRMLGTAAMRRADWAPAAFWFDLALQTNPSDVASLNDFGQSLAALGRTEEAVMIFRRAVALRPDLHVLEQNLRSAITLQARRPTTRP